MAKKPDNKFGVDFNDTPDVSTPDYERQEKRGPGRPIGKRSNPAYRQITALIRIDTHARAVEKLRRVTAKPDFGEYIESLIQQDLQKP